MLWIMYHPAMGEIKLIADADGESLKAVSG